MFKFERDDVVKIPFKGKIVDGRVKDCRVYYDSKEKKAYNQYSVKIRGLSISRRFLKMIL